MTNLKRAGAALLLLALLVFVLTKRLAGNGDKSFGNYAHTGAASGPVAAKTAPAVTEARTAADTLKRTALARHQNVCRSFLDTINGEKKAWGSWTSSGAEISVLINASYFELPSELTENINEALRCAGAADPNAIGVVKYIDQDTQQTVLVWKQGSGFRALL